MHHFEMKMMISITTHSLVIYHSKQLNPFDYSSVIRRHVIGSRVSMLTLLCLCYDILTYSGINFSRRS